VAKGGGSQRDDKSRKGENDTNAKSESRIRTLEFGAGLVVYGPSDDEKVLLLRTTNQEYQKVEEKINTHGQGPELQSFAARLRDFRGLLEKQGQAQDSVRQDIPDKRALMMSKGDMPMITNCGTANTTQDSGIGRTTVRVLGSMWVQDPEPIPESQKEHWAALEDAGAEAQQKDKAAARAI